MDTLCAKVATIYDDLGVKPVINLAGHLTVLGGSSPSPRVKAAMDSANRYFVQMAELLERSGKIVAGLLGTEAAYVTSGASAALALGAAACMTGKDPAKIAQLPDTTGMKNELVIQKRHRYHYDRPPTITGARLVEVGDDSGTTPEQLAAAIGPRTAAIEYPDIDWVSKENTVLLPALLEIARAKGVPVLVDAASRVYPVEEMKMYGKMGVDLVCFGGKYLSAPNSSGILAGRRDLIEAASMQGFVGYEVLDSHGVGRPFKLDRQEIVAVVVALQEWMEMDHAARLRERLRRAQLIAAAVEGVAGVTVEYQQDVMWADIVVKIDTSALGRSAKDVSTALMKGDPGIVVSDDWEDALGIWVGGLVEGDEKVVAARLREALLG
jgi:D-glucosaminate-6-phosphate ammonia-lyase